MANLAFNRFHCYGHTADQLFSFVLRVRQLSNTSLQARLEISQLHTHSHN